MLSFFGGIDDLRRGAGLARECNGGHFLMGGHIPSVNFERIEFIGRPVIHHRRKAVRAAKAGVALALPAHIPGSRKLTGTFRFQSIDILIFRPRFERREELDFVFVVGVVGFEQLIGGRVNGAMLLNDVQYTDGLPYSGGPAAVYTFLSAVWSPSR